MLLRNFFKAVVLSLFIALAIPATSFALDSKAKIESPTGDSLADSKIAAKIIQRVYEIQSMDKTMLSPAEKKSLRKELKEMKSQAADLNKGVYISIGAVIIIILLLILILR